MNEIGIGTIGCGGFALFSLEQYASIEGVRLVALSEPNPVAADTARRRFNLPESESIESLCARPDVDLVYIATPPFLHHDHALAALQSGKHVVCEKPLAITLAEADEMLTVAKQNDVLLVANLLQRYNPLSDFVEQLIDTEVLGELLHGFFENYASDESLDANHWFWDKDKSGGIFVEHGVHFFDLFQAWLGKGEVVAAQSSMRAGTTIEEQVQCSVRYRDSVLVNFYHGFHQIGHMDRQELRLVFERGEVSLFGWIPTMMQMKAVVNECDREKLLQIFPGAAIDVLEDYPPTESSCRGRHKRVDVDQKIRLTCGEESQKMTRYGELVRALMEDQLEWIADRSHQRRITEANGRESLRMAVTASQLAETPNRKIAAAIR